MAASLDSPSPAHLSKESTSFIASSSPIFSPGSDKRFWSNLRNRVDTILTDRETAPNSLGRSARAKRLKEDSLLLLRGFDSVTQTLSQLSNNLDNALQGARDLAKPPTLTDILHSHMKNTEDKEEGSKQKQDEEEKKKGVKRKFDPSECSDDKGDDSEKENEKNPKTMTMKKAKNLAISMATKAATLARELKSIKSDLCFMQERCALLEEENRRLRDGFAKGIRPEEDDLVRLQLEALLAEKSRLANENANLVRENQCLHQLVEYHQIASQDLSASYEEVLRGVCLDFSSPVPEESIDEEDEDIDVADNRDTGTPSTDVSRLFTSLDDCFDKEQ
ncbi:hypothetical protein SLE2022_244960 [Rubroshorea leprosula]